VNGRSVLAGLTASMMLLTAAPAIAAPPGSGDKQCTPGQNAQPKPAQKGGTCPPR
jgi:hypothetical protein